MITFIRGDWRFFWPENIHTIAHIPSAWDSVLNTGIGTPDFGSLWITSYLNLTALISAIGIPWEVISIIFWILPCIILSFISSYYLFTFLFPQKKYFGLFSGILYTTNTYFLLIFGGGQLGIALAYSIVPLILLSFTKLLRQVTIIYSLVSGLLLAILALFDPRVTYLTVIAIFIYWILQYFSFQSALRYFLYVFIIPLIVTVLFHSFWIIPLLLTHFSSVPSTVIHPQNLAFFSFADFPHAFALLHPNWPENIFGKVYFLQPEFLLLPLFAYGSLLFLSIRQSLSEQKNLLFFSLLGLIGAFFAKGTQPLFGELYTWSFIHIPGFQLFRDPTKWYLYISFSYAMLVPFTLASMYTFIKKKIIIRNKWINKYVANIFLILFSCYLLFLIKPLFSSQSQMFRPKVIPNNYFALKNFLIHQKKFSRTLWIPSWQRYGFFSFIHPAVGREELLRTASIEGQITLLQQPGEESFLQQASVKYIIVPDDTEGEIFVKNHKYDASLYAKTVNALTQITWLTKQKTFGKIVLFSVINPFPHIYATIHNAITSIPTTQYSQTSYALNLVSIHTNTIVFTESYDSHWILTNNHTVIYSKPYNRIFNSFSIPLNSTGTWYLIYKPQQWVELGLLCTLGIVIIIVFSYVYMKTNLLKRRYLV